MQEMHEVGADLGGEHRQQDDQADRLRGLGTPAAARTAAGPTVNHALPGASRSRPGDDLAAQYFSEAGEDDRRGHGDGNEPGRQQEEHGTSASCTGEVHASGRSNRAPWASEIIAMLSSKSRGSAGRASGAAR